ncbi:MAG: hypothetical protein NTZ56_03425 [Acidobacteria bacterium]|nr:hypothetical protein [Acidobacteriota bacterium]
MAFPELVGKALLAAGGRLVEAASALFETHPLRIAIAGVLTVLAFVTASIYIERVDRYQEIVSSTVRAEMEDTPQRFKVLEAFILSAVDDDLSSLVREATISTEFTDRLNDLHQIFSRRHDESSPDDVHVSIPNGVGKEWGQRSQNAILTDSQDPGYLFFPLKLLRARFDKDVYTEIFNRSAAGQKLLYSALQADPVIADDIEISRRASEGLAQFPKIPLFSHDVQKLRVGLEEYPVQVYYVTKNGVNRIVNYSGKNQRIVYQNLFRATTFFPSRPYFVQAFQRGEPQQLANVSGKIKDVFYVSQPYLDIGGFGVVITISRAVRYNGHSDAALCFDLRVNSPISFQLKEKLRSFGADRQEVTCDIGFQGKIDCKPKNSPGDVSLDEVQANLMRNLRIAMSSGDLSTVVGNINTFSRPEHEVKRASAMELITYPYKVITGEGTAPISFSVPINSPVAAGNNTLRAEFLLCNLNLGRFSQITSVIGFSSIILLMIAFFVVVLSWQLEVQNRSGWQSAFDVFDGVMYGATTAYCRLDNDDRIVDCNTSFVALLKRPPDKVTVDWIKGQTFESHISPRSKGTYQDVQRRRRSNDGVAPYTIFFACSDGTEIETRVTSGLIPSGNRGRLPQTFGVVIPSSIDAPVSKVSNDSIATSSAVTASKASGAN